MVKYFLDYAALIFAIVLGVAYLIWRAGAVKKLRAAQAVSYVCDECGEKDCICHKQEPPHGGAA